MFSRSSKSKKASKSGPKFTSKVSTEKVQSRGALATKSTVARVTGTTKGKTARREEKDSGVGFAALVSRIERLENHPSNAPVPGSDLVSTRRPPQSVVRPTPARPSPGVKRVAIISVYLPLGTSQQALQRSKTSVERLILNGDNPQAVIRGSKLDIAITFGANVKPGNYSVEGRELEFISVQSAKIDKTSRTAQLASKKAVITREFSRNLKSPALGAAVGEIFHQIETTLHGVDIESIKIDVDQDQND